MQDSNYLQCGKRERRLLTLAGWAACALFPAMFATASARAETVTVEGMEYARPAKVRIKAKNPSLSETVTAGEFLASMGDSSFLAFSVDLYKDIDFGEAVKDYSLVNASTLFGSGKADDLGRLATGFYSQVKDAVSAGAFQVAVWEIVNEKSGNPYNLDAGGFKASGERSRVLTTAQYWLDHLPRTDSYSVEVWKSPSSQNLAVFSPASTILSPVPEPETYGLLLLGLAAAALSTRRRRGDASGSP